MEWQAARTKEEMDARDKVRVQLARATKVAAQMAADEDLSDVPPHLLGR